MCYFIEHVRLCLFCHAYSFFRSSTDLLRDIFKQLTITKRYSALWSTKESLIRPRTSLSPSKQGFLDALMRANTNI